MNSITAIHPRRAKRLPLLLLLAGLILAVSGGIPHVSSAETRPPDAASLLSRLDGLYLDLVETKKRLEEILEGTDRPVGLFDVYFALDGGAHGPSDFHASPRFLSLSLDGREILLYRYPDHEKIALEQHGVHRLHQSILGSGEHLLTVSYGGLEKNGRKYLKVHPIPFTKTAHRLRIMLYFHEGEEGPQLHHEIWRGGAERAVPDYDNFRARRMTFLETQEDPLSSAILALQRLEGQPPGFAREEVLFSLAHSYFQLKLMPEAERLFLEIARMTDIPSRRAEAWFYVQKAQYARQRDTDAIEAFSRSIVALSPSSIPEALYLAGNSHVRLGSLAEAERFFGRIPVNDPFHPYGLMSLAIGMIRDGQTPRAIKTLVRVQELAGRDLPRMDKLKAHAHLLLGYLHLETGNSVQALSELASIPAGYQSPEKILYGRGWASLKADDFATALVSFSDLSSQFSETPFGKQAPLVSGHIYSKLKLFNHSLRNYRNALHEYRSELRLARKRLAHLSQANSDDPVPIPAVAQALRLTRNELLGIAYSSLTPAASEALNWNEILEAYDRLERLEREILGDHRLLPKGEFILLARDIRDLQDRLIRFRADLKAYLDRLRIEMLRRQVEALDRLAVEACIGIANYFAAQITESYAQIDPE